MQTHVLKMISRRQALAYLGAAGASIALSGIACAGPEEVAARINDITGGAAGAAEAVRHFSQSLLGAGGVAACGVVRGAGRLRTATPLAPYSSHWLMHESSGAWPYSGMYCSHFGERVTQPSSFSGDQNFGSREDAND